MEGVLRSWTRLHAPAGSHFNGPLVSRADHCYWLNHRSLAQPYRPLFLEHSELFPSLLSSAYRPSSRLEWPSRWSSCPATSLTKRQPVGYSVPHDAPILPCSRALQCTSPFLGAAVFLPCTLSQALEAQLARVTQVPHQRPPDTT